jgi:hypothetical protein
MEDLHDLESLRADGRLLRPHPDSAMLTRVRNGVRARIDAPVSPVEMLAGWIRPAAIAVMGCLAGLLLMVVIVPESFAPEAMAAILERMLISGEMTDVLR